MTVLIGTLINHHTYENLMKLILLIVIIFILYLTNITSLIYGLTIYPFLEKPFESKTWKSADAIERGYMYEDLLESTNN